MAERGTELVGWYIEQQRERARLVWRDYDPSTVPPDYQGYYARDQRLASGPHPGEPTPEEVREEGTKFCVGTPADCIRFLELYEALGIEEVILLCAVGPAQHQEVLHTIRLFGEQVIPHFQARGPGAQHWRKHRRNPPRAVSSHRQMLAEFPGECLLKSHLRTLVIQNEGKHSLRTLEIPLLTLTRHYRGTPVLRG